MFIEERERGELQHIYPNPKLRKIFHSAWHYLPTHCGVWYLRLDLLLQEIFFKHNDFINTSVTKFLSKFSIKIFPNQFRIKKISYGY